MFTQVDTPVGVQPQPGIKSQQQQGSSSSGSNTAVGGTSGGGQSSTDQLVQLGGDKPAEKERNPMENLGCVKYTWIKGNVYEIPVHVFLDSGLTSTSLKRIPRSHGPIRKHYCC